MTTSELTVHVHRDYAGQKMGMWLFLFTEILLFGGLFILYAVYRSQHQADFHHAAAELDTLFGTMNTLILLSSSMTVAIGITTLQRGNRGLAIWLTWFTVACGAWFMVNKYFEWGAKFSHGIYPGSDHLATYSHGEILFFGLYFTMTGLHGLHVVIGMILLAVAAWRARNKPHRRVAFAGEGLEKLSGAKPAMVGSGGELWAGEAIDDTVEKVLFPLFYLIT